MTGLLPLKSRVRAASARVFLLRRGVLLR